MRPALFSLGLLSVMGVSTAGCSWSRFDTVTENSPIVLFTKPGSMKNGFGVSLSTATKDKHTSVLVGGAVNVSNAALYDIGDGDSPSTTAADSGYCSGGADCFLSSSLAGFANATGPDQVRPLCFAVGTGSSVKPGIILRCQDQSEYTLDMPVTAQKLLAFSIAENMPYDHPMVADRSDSPVLLVTLPQNHTAWFYPSGSIHFAELDPPKALIDDPSFGTSLTMLSVGSGRVFAIGVPGKSEVLLWRYEPGNAPEYVGCLGGIPGFGRALASGNVNADADGDLVVSDDTNVHVIDGRALFELPATDATECSFGALPSGGLIDSFGCGSGSSLAGCANSDFGAALAVGDLDGDGDGEVIVGAPRMTVRGESNAGALLVYDAESASDVAVADAKFLSSAEAGDLLGTSIVTPHVSGRDIIVAGAPGNGKAALFYCSPLLSGGVAGARCP